MTETTAPTRTPKKIKELEVMVSDVIRETADTTTIVFFTGNDRLEYKAGHFLAIRPQQFEALRRFTDYLEDVKGKKEKPRAYSLASAPHEKCLAITVKEERYVTGSTKYPPLLSPILVRRIERGAKMTVTGFTGPYTMEDDIEDQTDHVVHVGAGSGFVPNYSILKWSLEHHTKIRHTVVYSNKTWDEIIYRDALIQLQAKYPDRLSMYFSLTREGHAPVPGVRILQGRVDAEMLRGAIEDTSACRVFACGPAISPWDRKAAKEQGIEPAPRFLESALSGLEEIGVTKDRITVESYG